MKVVIVGQGYVGLPLALGAVEAGHDVVGLDLNNERVAALNSGHSVIDDVTDGQVAMMISRGYRASSSPEEYQSAEVIVICVPTPLGEERQPDLRAVRSAVADVAANARKGTLVVLESTTYPGTTSTEVAPALTRAGFTIGTDLFLAFSPERIDPGNQQYGVRNTPKVVGADDPASREIATAFYSSFIDEVVPVSGSAEAELTKLLENTYRHINIGLVNELAVVCHELDIDVWEVIRAASTKPFGFQAFYPGPGVGGHCIPIDPSYLNSRVRQLLDRPFRFVELAEDINSSMPAYVVSRAQDILNTQSKPLNGSRVLLLGITYKGGISDTRESPASHVAHLLTAKGAQVSYYDPFVEHWRTDFEEEYSSVSNVSIANRESDLTILLQQIPDLPIDTLVAEADNFFDTRGVTYQSSKAKRL